MTAIAWHRLATIFLLVSLAFGFPAQAAAQPQLFLPSLLPTGDALWSDQFALGPNQDVYAVTSNSSDVYVGGDFTNIGGMPANHLARYNLATHRWYPLGLGVNGRVEALALFGDKLYVGGSFNNAGGAIIHNLAMWNTTGQNWWGVSGAAISLSSGTPDVHALAVDGSGSLYVGGNFDGIGTVSVKNIARWNGSAWNAMNGGLGSASEQVYALAVSGSNIYAGGSFTSPQAGIARWDGSVWSGLGSGTYYSTYRTVRAIIVSGSLVYIAGDFDAVADSLIYSAHHVAKWNGSSWAPLGTPPSDGTDGNIYALALGSDGKLYAGGKFTNAGGSSFPHLARWDGANWSGVSSTIDPTIDGNVNALFAYGATVYAGGAFLRTGGYNANRIAAWDIPAANWIALGSSVNGEVRAIAASPEDRTGSLYIGGFFTSAGGQPAQSMVRWNPRSGAWSTLGSGLAGCSAFICSGPSVFAVLPVGNDIYIAGNFTSAGGAPANHIARWNLVDQQWHALGSGLTCSGLFCSSVGYALVHNGSCVIVGGLFSSAGGAPVQNLAQYCPGPATWGPVTYPGGTVSPNGSVLALAWDPSIHYLYVGGNFTSPIPYLLSVDPTAGGGMYPMPDTLNSYVQAISLRGQDVYIGGSFTNLNGIASASNIAVLKGYSGQHWSALGNGLNGAVNAFAWRGNQLVAGGGFTQSGALGLNHIAVWDGAAWSGLGSGADNTVYAVYADSDFIYPGGVFQQAGAKTANNLSRYGANQVRLPLVSR